MKRNGGGKTCDRIGKPNTSRRFGIRKVIQLADLFGKTLRTVARRSAPVRSTDKRQRENSLEYRRRAAPRRFVNF